MAKGRVILGMSGGVDSSVAAYLLRAQGYEVVGAMMRIWDGTMTFEVKRANACYGPNEGKKVERARGIAQCLGVAFHDVDLSALYRQEVLDYFRGEYLAGRTPNPCVVCNRKLKFQALWEAMEALGIQGEYFATGHYVQKRALPNGRFTLVRGRDLGKDQSYFLYGLDQNQLARTLFPLGYLTKEEVRALAQEAGLDFTSTKESQNFITGGYEVFFHGESKRGEIVHEDGQVLGEHSGIWGYTIGQRKGLGISCSRPLYVTRIDPERHRVIVGERSRLMGREFVAGELRFMAVAQLEAPLRAQVKIRYQHHPAPALLEPLEGGQVRVRFDEPQLSIAPGQITVFYRDEQLLGGGVILRTS